jgi:hypothetical protein
MCTAGGLVHPAFHALLAIVIMTTTWLLTDSSVTGVSIGELLGRMPTVQMTRAGVRALRDVASEPPQRRAAGRLRGAGLGLEAAGTPRALGDAVDEDPNGDVELGVAGLGDLSLASVVAAEIDPWSPFEVFAAEDLGMKMFNVVLEIIFRIFIALIVGGIYYYRVVKGYPKLEEVDPNEDTAEFAHMMMSAGECEGCGMATFVLGCCALVCPAPRLAHTLHSTGKMNYWVALLLGTFLQPCMVLYGSACTSLRKDLGGEGAANRKCHRATCAFCCPCCVIAKQAQALDMKVGWRTTWLGASELQVDENGEYMNIAMARLG